VRFFQKLLADFTFCLAHEPVMDFKVEGDAITWSGIPLDTRDGSNHFLARACFTRQISSLRFTRGLTAEDLEILFDLLAMDVEDLRNTGGAVELLRGKGSGSLQVEQVDYEGILERRMEITESDESSYGSETISPAAPPEAEVEQEKAAPRFTEDHTPEVSQDEWLAVKLRELDAADRYQDPFDLLIGRRPADHGDIAKGVQNDLIDNGTEDSIMSGPFPFPSQDHQVDLSFFTGFDDGFRDVVCQFYKRIYGYTISLGHFDGFAQQ